MKKVFSSLGLAIALTLAGQPSAAGDATVIQKNRKFSTASVTVKKGGAVTFVNEDPFAHNVYSQTPGLTFDILQQSAGQSSDVKFNTVGQAEVRCAIHPTMKMTVNVTD